MFSKAIAQQLYDETFARFCNELSHDKNHLQAKAMALWKVDGILKESLFHDFSVFGRGRTGLWEEIKAELEKL